MSVCAIPGCGREVKKNGSLKFCGSECYGKSRRKGAQVTSNMGHKIAHKAHPCAGSCERCGIEGVPAGWIWEDCIATT